VDKVDTLRNIALEALDASIQQSLFLFRDVAKNVDRLLNAVGAELDRDRKEIAASLLRNGGATRDPRKINEAGLDKSGLALDSPQEFLGKSRPAGLA